MARRQWRCGRRYAESGSLLPPFPPFSLAACTNSRESLLPPFLPPCSKSHSRMTSFMTAHSSLLQSEPGDTWCARSRAKWFSSCSFFSSL